MVRLKVYPLYQKIGAFFLISIPYGAIKRKPFRINFKIFVIFQFLMVRLKEKNKI